jgi:hypothetical protein
MKNLEQVINEKFNQTIKYMKVQPINLGGVAAAGGGSGGPPGGYTGYLPQTRVAYDMTEAGTLVTMSGIGISGASIVDNLNHIRYRLQQIETFTIYSGVFTEDASLQIGSVIYTTSGIYAPGTLCVYFNGLRQSKNHYTEVSTSGFTVNFSPVNGDSILLDYMVAITISGV